VGSITQANKYTHLLVPSYKITKAALNMLTKQYAVEFADAGFTFALISPGVSGEPEMRLHIGVNCD